MTETGAKAPILRVRSGARAGLSLVIREPIVVGREAEFTLEDQEVSRRHAQIRPAGAVLVIADLGSSNGTWVNGKRVEHAVLQPGDVLTLGRTIFDVIPSHDDAATKQGSDLSSFAAAAAAPASGPARIEEELRPITALFADIVASTALGERLAPDEVSSLVGECVSRMSDSVERFGGIVTTYTGDGIAAFFGLDQASEQDADCAAHAALTLISAVARYSADAERVWGITDLNVRVGLNTGDAAVGALGSAERANVALGDTTNVAARLQALAEPGTIAIGDETADELRGRFLVEPLGEIHVKGRRAAVRAWRLLGALERPSTPERRRLLGRDPEVALLRSVVDDVCAGQGRLLFVVGDLGIGKTRLLAELEGIVGQRAALLQAFCAASPAPPPYGPFVALLRAWLGTEPGERGPALRAKLRLRLESLGGSASGTADGLARLLSLGEENGDRDAIDPGEAYAAWVEALAARRPLVIALDDIHWLEPSSALLALTLAELAMRLPLLFVSTLRPDHQSHGWRIRTSARVAHPSRARELNLEPLSDEQARELLGELAPDIDPATCEEIVRRAEGNPLFVEQLFRAFREGASFPLGPSSVRTVATAQLLPPALASVFVGRIDRLPADVRKVTQTAAAIGRTFPKSLLIRVDDPEIVEAAVPALLNAAIVAERHPQPDQSWSFTHALLRDAALSTLVRSRRRELFSRVAAAFEASVGDASDEHLELLAYYYARSDDLAKALYYHERAAEKAFRVGADTEASGRLRLAAQFAAQLVDDEAAKRIAARLEH